jgi:hypothetical protein
MEPLLSTVGVVHVFSSLLVFSLMVSGRAKPAMRLLLRRGKPVKERKICRDSDDSTSRVAKRVCRTAKEWEDGGKSGPKAGVRRGSPSN